MGRSARRAAKLLGLAACGAAPVLVAARGMLADDPTALGRTAADYAAAVSRLDLEAVKADIEALLTSSQDFWPADYGHYGPLFVRLAWHCSGSYRSSDGRGGCDGGRQRFDPERSWDDNTNLDKARALLWPIKEKYGLGLSWGDLIVLAGTTAIESMGGPTLGFCAGRVDDVDGSWSAELGPTPEQEQLAPCLVNGQCKEPLGATTLGLIYVNPEGPMGQPLPNASAVDVRDTFGRMNMNDSETVALIGGGHAFGKTHGACPDGPGPSPKEDPYNPWPGKCGTGKGADTFTSGFEGPWTPTPTRWSYSFFRDLLANDWEVHVGPGGKHQWRAKNATGSAAGVMRLTSDVSLLHDPAYRKVVEEYDRDHETFDSAWAHAWYKLTTRDMGPVTRCVGKLVPPPQAWQYPLPPAPARLADFNKVKGAVRALLHQSDPSFPADEFAGVPYYGGLLVRLAWRCAGTFRQTDFQGGCNGARLRLSPQKDWPANKALDHALALLKPIKDRFGSSLSWADLIVLAGTTAIEEAGGRRMPFCGGRTDAEQDGGPDFLQPRVTGETTSVPTFRDSAKVAGLTNREITVLVGGGHSLGKMHADRSGFEGAWTPDPTQLSNSYFKALLSEAWEEHKVAETGKVQYKAKGKDLYMLKSDLVLKADAELLAIAQEYAADNSLFLRDFAKAWTKLMNADRFDGPAGNLCDRQVHDDTVDIRV